MMKVGETSDEDDRLELALKASNEGVWDWQLESGEIFYSNRVLGFLGYGRVGAPNIFADLSTHVHPEDLAGFKKKLTRVTVGGGRLLAIEPRIKTSSGHWKWFRIRATPVHDEDGKVDRLVGSIIDISKRKNAEAALAEEQQRIELLFENVPVNVYFKDLNSHFIRANRSTALRMGAGSVKDLLGKTDHDFFDAAHADAARACEMEIIRTGEPQKEKLEHEIWDDGRETWVMVTKNPWRGSDGQIKGTFGVTHDVSELMKAQNEVAAVTRQLSSVNQEIEGERHLLRLVIDNIPMYVYFKNLESQFVLVNQGMVELFDVKSTDEIIGKHDRDFFGEGFGEIASSDEAAVMEACEPIVGRLERIPWANGKVTYSLTSKFPWIDKDGKIAGTFGVSADVTELVETRNELAKITEVLGRKNQAIQEELQLAREVQQAAIPECLPTFQSDQRELHFYHRYEPASDLAGDFFKVIPLGNDRVGFLICDVMGHGVRAALIVSMLRGLIEKALDYSEEPRLFLKSLNDGLSHLLERTSLTMFATALYGVVDLDTMTLRVSSAGHPAPLLKREGEVEQMVFGHEDKGMALGLLEGLDYQEQEISLNEVDAFMCFTDGLPEVENEGREEFGTDRMAQILTEATDLRLGMDRALCAGREFSEKDRFEDDVCLLGLEVRSLS